jgi:transposase, IS5 family
MIKTSLFADQEREAKLNKLGDALLVMEQHVDFVALAQEVDRAAPRPSRERGGRPPFPTELMVRVLLIQAGASESIFEAVNRQLSKHGYIARGGQMIDASIVQAPKQSLSKEEKALVREGAMPVEWKPAKRRQKDTEARWTKKHGKSYFGYKVSVNADKRYKLVRKIKVSTASEHDTLHFEEVLDPTNTNSDILADKGYVDSEREERLSKQGWRMHIQRKGSKDKPISATQKRRNHRIAKTRAHIEHVFAGLAQMGGKERLKNNLRI